MILAIAVITVQSTLTASDFFPMEAGMKWTYESTGDQAGMYDQAIGAPEPFGDKSIAPVLTLNAGKILLKTFYQTSPSGLYILGHDPAKPFVKPQPVFQFDPKGAKWTYEGPSPYESDGRAGMRSTGESRIVGDREYFGEKRPCLEVKTVAKIGMTTESATEFRQTMLFAKGVGMVSMDQTAKFGRRTTKLKVTIVKFEKTGTESK